MKPVGRNYEADPSEAVDGAEASWPFHHLFMDLGIVYTSN
jgi:hypothetical protein